MPTKRVESEAERRARYAAKDVTDKLGIKPGQAVRVVGNGDPTLLAKVRAKTGRALDHASMTADVVLYWPPSWEEIAPTLRELKMRIAPNGGIWVISCKKGKGDPVPRALEARETPATAGVAQGEPYLPDSLLIPLGLAAGLVDNKVCSVSDTHSAMRFVIRRTERR